MTLNIPHRNPMKYSVELNCGHTLYFASAPPMHGDIVYCQRCEYESVVIRAPHEAAARCLSCPFRFAREQDRSHAEKRAWAHLAAFPTHRVRVTLGGVRVATLGAREKPLASRLAAVRRQAGTLGRDAPGKRSDSRSDSPTHR